MHARVHARMEVTLIVPLRLGRVKNIKRKMIKIIQERNTRAKKKKKKKKKNDVS